MKFANIFKKRLYKKVLSAVEMVKVGILDRLSERYQPEYGKEAADLLAAAVVNELFSHKPSDSFLQEFSEINKEVVERKISKLTNDEEIRHVVAQTFRVEAIVCSDEDGNLPDSLLAALENLERLGMLVPGEESPTPKSFVRMANEFYQGRSNL